jgi:pimeloyl-ACP methyl ester carboxylesterase
MAAMWVASHAPERVDRMVLVCTSARLGPPELWRSRAATVREQGMAGVVDGVLGRWLTADFVAREPSARDGLRAMLLATPSDGYAACCGAVETMDLEDDLAAVTAPTLVIAGLEDEATPPAHAQAIVARIPGATLALVAGAAHLANVARPELVGELMSDHLTGKPS